MIYPELTIEFEEHVGREVYCVWVASEVDGLPLYLTKEGKLTRFRGGRCGFVSWEKVLRLVKKVLRGEIGE